MADCFQQSFHIVKLPDPPEPPVNSAEAIELDDPFAEVAEILDGMGGWSFDYDFPIRDWTAALVREGFEKELTFTVDEGRYDELEDIGATLSDLGFSWYGIVHPKYEFMGEFHAYTPELGKFSAECDDDGNIRISEFDLRTWIDEATDLEDLRERINRATGRAWHDELFAKNKDTT